MIPKVEQEITSHSPGADIIITEQTTAIHQLSTQGQLVSPSGPLASSWPSKYLEDGGQWFIGNIEPFVIAYNKSKVKTPPTGYSDALNGQYSGKIATTAVLGTPAIVGFYQFLLQNYGSDYLQRLGALHPQLLNGATPIGQAVASGEDLIGLFAVPSAVIPLAKTGAPIAYVTPSPATGIGYGVAVLKNAQHPDAALVLANFLMSKAGQEAWGSVGGQASPLNLPGGVDPNSVTQTSLNWTPDQISAFTSQFTKAVG